MKTYRDIKKQRGSSLLEILITLVVLGIGLVSLAKFESGVKGSITFSEQQAHASHLAQRQIEKLKDLRNSDDYQALASSNGSTVVGSGQNTEYTLTWTVQPSGNAEEDYQAIKVEVQWLDRTGSLKKVSLHTLAGKEDVLRVAALSIPAIYVAAGECQDDHGDSDGDDNDGNDDGHDENDGDDNDGSDEDGNSDGDDNDGSDDGHDENDGDDNDGNDDGHEEDNDSNSDDNNGAANPCEPIEDSCDDDSEDSSDDGHEEDNDGHSNDTSSPCNGSEVEDDDSSSDDGDSDDGSDDDSATLEDFDNNMDEVENDDN